MPAKPLNKSPPQTTRDSLTILEYVPQLFFPSTPRIHLIVCLPSMLYPWNLKRDRRGERILYP